MINKYIYFSIKACHIKALTFEHLNWAKFYLNVIFREKQAEKSPNYNEVTCQDCNHKIKSLSRRRLHLNKSNQAQPATLAVNRYDYCNIRRLWGKNQIRNSSRKRSSEGYDVIRVSAWNQGMFCLRYYLPVSLH
jgi:hypothetical protein